MVALLLRSLARTPALTLTLRAPALAPATGELGRSLWEGGANSPALLPFLAPALLTLVATVALASLLRARRPVEAIFSFFAWICIVALGLFALGADYLGAILLMVYAGAVLIFFVFVLFTVDPRWFGDAGCGAPAPLALGLAALLALLARPQLPAPALGGSGFLPAPAPLATPALGRHGSLDLGTAFFGQYWLATTVLAALLLLVLVVTIALLSRGGPRRRPSLGTLLAPAAGDALRSPVPLALLALPGASYSLYLSLTLTLAVLFALGPRSTQFLFLLLCLEAATLAVLEALSAAGVATASAEGNLFALYLVALSAAEVALALALYLALRSGSAPLRPRKPRG
jgi:NADH-quinone oxidoreductase subunit J